MSKQFKKTKPDPVSQNGTPIITDRQPSENTHSQEADRHLKFKHPHSDKE